MPHGAAEGKASDALPAVGPRHGHVAARMTWTAGNFIPDIHASQCCGLQVPGAELMFCLQLDLGMAMRQPG